MIGRGADAIEHVDRRCVERRGERILREHDAAELAARLRLPVRVRRLVVLGDRRVAQRGARRDRAARRARRRRRSASTPSPAGGSSAACDRTVGIACVPHASRRRAPRRSRCGDPRRSAPICGRRVADLPPVSARARPHRAASCGAERGQRRGLDDEPAARELVGQRARDELAHLLGVPGHDACRSSAAARCSAIGAAAARARVGSSIRLRARHAREHLVAARRRGVGVVKRIEPARRLDQARRAARPAARSSSPTSRSKYARAAAAMPYAPSPRNTKSR